MATAASVLGAVLASTALIPAQTADHRPASASAAPAQPAAGSSRRALIDRYCAGCHNKRLRVAGVALDVADVDRPERDSDLWEKVVFKLRSHQMPPPSAPQPPSDAALSLRLALEADLDRDAIAHPRPSRVTAHRLNRAEYTNAIRDVLALDIDGAAFLPADEADRDGFDNSSTGLSASPALVERYLSAASRISRLALGHAGQAPGFDTFKTPLRLFQDQRAHEDLPFGSRGGIAISYRFPVDADYAIRLKLRRQIYDYIVGMGRRQLIDVRIDGALVKRFEIGGDGHGMPGPHTWIGQVVGDPEWESHMHHADDDFEVRVPVKAGTRLVGVSFVDTPYAPEGVKQPPQRGFGAVNDEDYEGHASIDTVLIGGPFNPSGAGDTSSRRRVLICTPRSVAEEEPCARRIVAALARRAFRRSVDGRDLSPLLDFYVRARREKGDFDAGIQAAVERLLVSPDFLYRIERAPERSVVGAIGRIGDVDLASRLSFFLWSSVPDDELLDLATAGRLQASGVLEQQVRRMLADDKADALIDNFAAQWLETRKIRTLNPDLAQFPDWDENLREAMEQEVGLFVRSQMRDNREVLDLLQSDYTFLNERLARHYGVPNIYGERFRRVPLTGRDRGGLLGQAGILAVTSYPNRTSPVLRGRWVLANILGMPPPPPPPDVPALTEGAAAAGTSVRQRMEEHRKNPACAACHVRMDPIGFALENFDAIGAWRTVSDGARIDPSGAFPDGTRFDGPEGLRRLLVQHREDVVMTVSGKMLSYALGRPLETFDRPAIRRIVREATASGARWTDILLGVVQSTPFRMRRADS